MKQSGAANSGLVVGALLFVAAAASHGAGVADWTYRGKTGPDKWGQLDKDFAQCKLGQFQSPIDIPDATARKGDLQSLLFSYKPSPIRIIDNGHTIQANYAPGSVVSVADKSYELVQINFHSPSEEKINGKAHDMEVQLVHKGPGGKLGVIAVLIDRGKENRLVSALWSNLPKVKDKEVVVTEPTINALDLLPENKGYYTFAGSLTTPPCSEDVTWFVLKTPVQLSSEQIARFEKLYPMNARPVQPLNGRDVAATR
jgi:carbonic anhydrase